MVVVKNLVCDGDKLINKIKCKYQAKFGWVQFGWIIFFSSVTVGNPFFKSMHKATMRPNLLFWQQAILSESCKHLSNLRI